MRDLIAYCIEYLSNKKIIYSIFDKYHIKYTKSFSYEMLSKIYLDSDVDINIEDFCSFYRANWSAAPIERHLEILSSKVLMDHSWHQAMPSILHLSMQNKVRECIDGKMEIKDLIKIGADIMKHEYFMVAIHDLCESMIIQRFYTTIPPVRCKSISDFVFNGIPYDLKVSTYPDTWTLTHQCHTVEEKIELIKSLYVGADRERVRKKAGFTYKNWGLNRFYVIVGDQDEWFNSPSDLVQKLIVKVSKLDGCIVTKIENFDVCFQLVEL